MVQFLLNSTNSPATRIPSPARHLHHTPPTHSPDAQGHTPSTRRALPRRRMEDSESSTPELSTPPPPPPPQNSVDAVQNQLLPSPNILTRPHRQGIRLPERFHSPEIPFNQQLKLCTRIVHQKPRHAFIDPQSNIEYDICNQCRRNQQQRQERECQWREHPSPEIAFNQQLKLCAHTLHHKPQEEFIDPHSGAEYNSCNECREYMRIRARERRQAAQEEERQQAAQEAERQQAELQQYYQDLWGHFDEYFPPDPNEEEDGISLFTYIFLTFRA